MRDSGSNRREPNRDLGGANVVSGTVAGSMVQAGVIHGDVHLHRPPPVVPRQLPPAPAHFTNRWGEKEMLDRITAGGGAVRRPSLAVLTGTGGSGKTAVALRWLHNNLDRFSDGQLYANLGAFGVNGPVSPSEVLNDFLRALGVAPEDIPLELAGRSALYRSMSAGKALAVFADDAESAAQVRPLLPASPDSVVVATSRHRLTGLALDGGRFVAVDALDEPSAVLLISRVVGEEKVAREPDPARRLAELCGGLPIALSIAAARLSTRPRWTISRVVGALADDRRRLSSLAVPGDASVQASLDLSYRALAPEAARMYRLLGLHPGPDFGLGAAAAAADLPPDDTDDVLADLVDASLVNETADGRFRFHDLLRLHATQRAEQEDGEAARRAAVHRVVTWYLDSAIAADVVVMPLRRRINDRYAQVRRQPAAFPDAVSALDWLDRERPNLLAAQRRAAAFGWWERAWQLCEAMWGMFLYRKHFEHWLSAHEVGIEAARRCDNAVVEARLTVQLGIAYLNLQRYDTAHDRFATAFEVSRTAGDPGTEASAREHLGLAARRAGDPAAAMAHFVAALAATERLGEHRNTARHLWRIGETLFETGRVVEALPYLRRAVAVATEVGDPVLLAQALTRLGATLTRVEEVDAARESLTEAVESLAGAGSDHYLADAVLALGDLRLHTGDRSGARRCFQQAFDLYRRSRMPRAQQVRARLDALDSSPDTNDA